MTPSPSQAWTSQPVETFDKVLSIFNFSRWKITFFIKVPIGGPASQKILIVFFFHQILGGSHPFHWNFSLKDIHCYFCFPVFNCISNQKSYTKPGFCWSTQNYTNVFILYLYFIFWVQEPRFPVSLSCAYGIGNCCQRQNHLYFSRWTYAHKTPCKLLSWRFCSDKQ